MKIYIYKIWKLRNTNLIVDILTTKLSKYLFVLIFLYW